MAHKVHPKIYRIRGINDWQSRGFYGNKFPQYLEEDLEIREFLHKTLREAGIAEISIERFAGKLNVLIDAMRPGVIIGRGGGGAERLKKELEKRLDKIRKKHKSAKTVPSKGEELKIEVRELRNPWISAPVVAQWVADQFEKRMPFRRVMKKSIERTSGNKEVKGVRIEVSGRLDGREIARREWLQKGRMPRQTIRADIDYSQKEAYCSYGVIGIKVWIYKGDKFD